MEKDSVSSKFDFSIQSISITADQQKLVAGSSGSIIVLPLKFLTAQEKIRKNQLETHDIRPTLTKPTIKGCLAELRRTNTKAVRTQPEILLLPLVPTEAGATAAR